MILVQGCKLKSAPQHSINWKAFHQQQSSFLNPQHQSLLMIDSVFNKLKLRKGMRVIDYGLYHGHFTYQLLKKEVQVLGLMCELLEIPSASKRFIQPWPKDYPGNLILQPWQAGKIPNEQFNLLIVQGRADELSIAFPQLAAQYCASEGGILMVNYQHLPQIGEAYCHGNTLSKPLLESIEQAGFQQDWELTNKGIRYLYLRKAPTN